MKEKIAKTNVARLLDKAKIAYELIPYEVDENDLSAVHVAASLGENIEQVFKTLVLHGDKSGYFVCVIPGEHEVDLKMAAKVSGNKKCDLIPMNPLFCLSSGFRGIPGRDAPGTPFLIPAHGRFPPPIGGFWTPEGLPAG